MKGVIIPFADKLYTVYRDGKIYSEYSRRYIKGKHLNKRNPRYAIDIRVDGVRHTLLINRLVYFLYKYAPKVLNKKNPTIADFNKMPMVVHIDGDIENNSLNNLMIFIDRHKLGVWSAENTPPKMRNWRKPSISDVDEIKKIKARLLKGETYASIARDYKVSDMCIYRLSSKRLLLKLNRPNGKPKLTKEQVKEIRSSKLPQILLSKKYNVTPTTISRVINNKTYNV